MIPIENIYYLLCYAWDKLEEKEKVKVDVAGITDLADLFARILINGSRLLLKRGIDKSYVEETLEYRGIKGKLEIGPTLKSGLHYKHRTVCTVDEFSADILPNQILITTIYSLLGTRELDSKLKIELKSLLWLFPGISVIELNRSVFNRVILHRNNRFYAFLINVCKIIHENLLPGDKPGEWQFIDFIRDKRKMNKLFEAFIRNFYRRQYPHWTVKSEILNWSFIFQNESDRDFLPIMRTDISILNDSGKTIIDAKYYHETLATYYGREKIHSSNLYQIFSYLMNQRSSDPASHETKGMLIYPTIETEFNIDFMFENHPILIRTVNLGAAWQDIEERLKVVME